MKRMSYLMSSDIGKIVKEIPKGYATGIDFKHNDYFGFTRVSVSHRDPRSICFSGTKGHYSITVSDLLDMVANYVKDQEQAE